MPLPKRWHPLERSTLGQVPDRYGVYELGDGGGDVLAVETGPLRDGIKTAIAYGDAAQVRWEATATRERAAELADEHRERLS